MEVQDLEKEAFLLEIQEYNERKEEHDTFQDIINLIDTKNKASAQVLDRAVQIVLDKKLSQYERELELVSDRLLSSPLDQLLLYTLPEHEYEFDNVDMDEVKAAWLGWVNETREAK